MHSSRSPRCRPLRKLFVLLPSLVDVVAVLLLLLVDVVAVLLPRLVDGVAVLLLRLVDVVAVLGLCSSAFPVPALRYSLCYM